MNIFSKASFNASVSRLRDALSLKSLVGDVTYQIQKDGNTDLASQVQAHFDKHPSDRGLDRKRANHALAAAATGEDYNVLSAKLKKLDSKAIDMASLVMHHGDELKNTCFTLSPQGESLQNVLRNKLETIINRHAKGSLPYNAIDMNAVDYTQDDCWNLLAHMLYKIGIQSMTTFGAAEIQHNGLEGDSVDICLYVRFHNEMNLHFNFTANKHNGEVEDFSASLNLENKEFSEFIYDGDDEAIISAFDEIAHFFINDSKEAELVDIEDPYYQAIATHVIPAMQFAALHR